MTSNQFRVYTGGDPTTEIKNFQQRLRKAYKQAYRYEPIKLQDPTDYCELAVGTSEFMYNLEQA